MPRHPRRTNYKEGNEPHSRTVGNELPVLLCHFLSYGYLNPGLSHIMNDFVPPDQCGLKESRSSHPHLVGMLILEITVTYSSNSLGLYSGDAIYANFFRRQAH